MTEREKEKECVCVCTREGGRRERLMMAKKVTGKTDVDCWHHISISTIFNADIILLFVIFCYILRIMKQR